MTKNPLEDLAPFPQTEEQVTAESLSRHLTAYAAGECAKAREQGRRAFVLWGRDMDEAAQRRYVAELAEYTTALNALGGWFAAAHLLRHALERMPVAAADEVARDLWRYLHGEGPDMGADLWEWLLRDGHDPARVMRAAELRGTEAAA